MSSYPFPRRTSLHPSQQTSHQLTTNVIIPAERPFASKPWFHPPSRLHIFTDVSVRGVIEDGVAGLLVLSQDELVHESHDPASAHGCSFQAEEAAHKEAIQWPSNISSWASAVIICDCKSLFPAISNANSPDSFVIQPQAAVVVLAMSKYIMTMWAPGHCGPPGNELAHHQAKLGAVETQHDNALEPAMRKALIHRSCRPPPI